jgi:hemoglobin-like flavoprotein
MSMTSMTSMTKIRSLWPRRSRPLIAQMTDDEIALVRKSLDTVGVVADVAAQMFYGMLFQIDPSLRGKFAADMAEQRHKFMETLHTAVYGLNDVPALIPVLEDLGRRHAGYGVREAHYDTAGKALIWTLQLCLEDEFTPQVRAAWKKLYIGIANVMQAAAREVMPAEVTLPVKAKPAAGFAAAAE